MPDPSRHRRQHCGEDRSGDVVEAPRFILGRDGPAHVSGDLLSLLKQLKVGRIAGRIVEQFESGLDVAPQLYGPAQDPCIVESPCPRWRCTTGA